MLLIARVRRACRSLRSCFCRSPRIELRGTTLVAPLVWMMLSLALWACAVRRRMRDAQGTSLPADRQAIVSVALHQHGLPDRGGAGSAASAESNLAVGRGIAAGDFDSAGVAQRVGARRSRLAHSVWKWFFAGLLVVGWLNYLPTRLMLATTLWCLPGMSWVLERRDALVADLCAGAGKHRRCFIRTAMEIGAIGSGTGTVCGAIFAICTASFGHCG